MKRTIFFLLLSFAFAPLTAQRDADVDSLYRILETVEEPQDILLTKVNLANYYLYHSLDSADKYVSQVLADPQANRFLPQGYSRHLLVKAWVHQGRRELASARDLMRRADSLLQRHGSRAEQLGIQANLSSVLLQLKDTAAWTYVAEAQAQLDTSAGRAERKAWLVNQYYKGRILGDQEQYRRAMEALLAGMASPVFREFPDWRDGYFNSMSVYLDEIGDRVQAKAYLRRALRQPGLYPFEEKMLQLNLAEQFLQSSRLDSCRAYLARVVAAQPFNKEECRQYRFTSARLAYAEGQYDTALNHIREANTCAADMQDTEVALIHALVEGKIRCRRGEVAMADRLLAQAKKLLHDHPALATLEYRTSVAELELHRTLAVSAPEAFSAMDRYVQLQGERVERAADKRLNELVVAYETLEKEKANAVLKRDNQIQRQANRLQQLWIGGLILLALAVTLIATFWRRNLVLVRANNEWLEEENEALVFERDELQALNTDLQERVQKSRATVAPDAMIWTVAGVEKVYRLPVSDILFGQAEDEGLRLHLADSRQVWVSQSLKGALEEVPALLRIHRSTLVNPDHITSFNSRSLTMAGGTTLNIGRRYKENIKERLHDAD